jgi:PAS domain S-box-containing protein
MVEGLKGTERALLECAEQTRLYCEQVPIPFHVLDSEKTILLANLAWRDLLGYSREEIIGRSFLDFLDREGMEQLRWAPCDAGPEGEIRETELRIRKKDGDHLRIICRSRALSSGGKGSDLQLCGLLDVTGQRLLVDALSRERKRLMAVFDAFQDGLDIINADYDLVYVNPILERVFGPWTGSKCYEYFAGRSAPCPWCLADEIMQGRTIRREWEYPQQGRVYDMIDTPIKDPDGTTMMMEIFRDVTDRKASEERYRNRFENSPMALWEEDFSAVKSRLNELEASGIKDLRAFLRDHPDEVVRCAELVRVIEANKAALELKQSADLAEFRQVSVRNVRNKTHRLFRDTLISIAAGETEFEFEYVTSTSRDEDRYIQLRWVAAPGCETSLSKVLVSVVDLSERKKAEDAARRAEIQLKRYSEELEQIVAERTIRIRDLEKQRAESEKLAATGRMAARIAHEINNPLAGIKNAFLLLKGIMDKDHPHFAYSQRVEKEIDRIAHIVHRMFDIYAPNKAKTEETLVTEVIDEVGSILESSSRAAGVNLVTELSPEPVKVLMPRGSLNQIVFNLIQNAIEVSEAGGGIRVSTEVQRESVFLRVADGGPGIPDEIGNQVFEPFFTTKDEGGTGGLGLGLSVSKGLVEAVGGSISFSNNAEGGTTFTVKIPLRESQG